MISLIPEPSLALADSFAEACEDRDRMAPKMPRIISHNLRFPQADPHPSIDDASTNAVEPSHVYI